ncbi:TPA: hypothetical protein SMF39_004413 [Serratia marcescens]|nr:hypothetical protein [Serratia marcescens]
MYKQNSELTKRNTSNKKETPPRTGYMSKSTNVSNEMGMDFFNQFDPSRGDMIFGLSSEIAKYRSWWAFFSRRADYLAALIPVEINSEIHSQFINRMLSPDALVSFQNAWADYGRMDKDERSIINTYYENVLQAEDAIYEKIIERQDGCFHAFNNIKLARKYTAHLKNHERYAFRQTFFSYGLGLFESTREKVISSLGKFISRASKAGLDMIISSAGDEKVHFILDGINLSRVILKEGEMSFTGAELRYLYRNRKILKDKVKFYRNGKETPPPWEDNASSWNAYKKSTSHPPFKL